jgi:thioredoxin-dependent peroxiredoxin
MVAKGDTAPDFEALDHSGTTFKFSSLKGAPVVLYFYPKADTPGCTIEGKGFRDVYADYQAKHVHIVGVSVDDCADQQAFRQKYGFPFPLIADKDRKVSGLYGVVGPSGNAKRVSFLIDSKGKVIEVVEGSPDTHLKRASEVFLAK